MRQSVNLIPIDINDDAHVRVMFEIRGNPQVDQYLSGLPPTDFSGHINYLKTAVSKKDFFVISFKDVLCGYCQATLTEMGIELGWALHPNWWGKGIGKESISLLIEEVRKKYHATKFYLYVKPENARAIYLYQQFGFVQKDSDRKEILMEL